MSDGFVRATEKRPFWHTPLKEKSAHGAQHKIPGEKAHGRSYVTGFQNPQHLSKDILVHPILGCVSRPCYGSNGFLISWISHLQDQGVSWHHTLSPWCGTPDRCVPELDVSRFSSNRPNPAWNVLFVLIIIDRLLKSQIIITYFYE